jgi:hypothetical protein
MRVEDRTSVELRWSRHQLRDSLCGRAFMPGERDRLRSMLAEVEAEMRRRGLID